MKLAQVDSRQIEVKGLQVLRSREVRITRCWGNSHHATCHPFWDCSISALGLEHHLIWELSAELLFGARIFFLIKGNFFPILGRQ